MRRYLVIALVIATFGGILWWIARPQPIPVVLVEVGRGTVEASVSNTRAGSVEACQRTRLSPIAGGRITYLGAREGDRVKQGEVLLRLWNEDQQAQSDFARSQVASARQRKGEACSVAENARREAQRMQQLQARGFVSAAREETARLDAQAKAAGCAAASADIRQAEARLRVTEVEQGRTVLVAPFDGTVAEVVGELGEYTTPSPPGVATPPAIDLINDSCLYISAPMDEVDAPKIRPGQVARVTLDALPGQVFAAHVRRVAPYVLAVEKQARTVEVEADLDQRPAEGSLRVGYSADIEVILATRANVLRIPTSTLMEGGRVLRYVPQTGRLEARAIRTGLSNWEFVEVVGGLQAGDRIVASLEREGVAAGVRVSVEAAGGK